MSYSMLKELKPASFLFALSDSSPVLFFFYFLEIVWVCWSTTVGGEHGPLGLPFDPAQ